MPIPSPYPDVEIPDVDTWGLLFERKDRPYPDDHQILIDPETSRSYNYAQIRSTARSFGVGLKQLWDWRKGDVLGIYALNCIDTPAIVWGCHWAGGILSPANPTYTAKELAFQLKDSGAKALVTQWPFIETAKQAAALAGVPEQRIILIGDGRDASAGFRHFSRMCKVPDESFTRTKVDADKDLAFLVYSSGTTGLPKGVMLSHRNVVSNVLMHIPSESPELKWNGGSDGKGDKVLTFLPYFHIYGLVVLMHLGLYKGLPTVVMPRFDIEQFCQLVQKYKISYSYVAPPVVLLLSKHPVVAKYDLSSLKMISSGAAPLTKELVESVYERLNLPVKQGYGLSETSPTTHSQRWSDWRSKVGSVGHMLPNQTAKFMSSEDKELPVGETGELWIKGPNVFKGYLNRPEQTADCMTSDGYFKTGDIGYLDKDGCFYITDRVKELIKYKGYQVAPAELEGILISHPKIVDVAVIGVYDKDQASELPRAYVVLGPDGNRSQSTAQDIMKWLEGKVAPHKRLRGGVRFTDEVPKSISGKILRRVLKDQAKQEQQQSKSKL